MNKYELMPMSQGDYYANFGGGDEEGDDEEEGRREVLRYPTEARRFLTA